MKGKLYTLGILGIIVVFAVALSLGFVWLALSFSGVGVTGRTGGLPLSVCDLSAVPQSVAEDTTKLATELFGDRQEKRDVFVSQLLALYSEAKDRDFIMLFNSGGWGGKLLEDAPGWQSISSGIQSTLNNAGHTSLPLNYQRSGRTIQGYLNEFAEMMTGYTSKAKDLASRVEFLTSHIPNLRVIITGESNATIFCDSVMNILRDNPQVYSIQTGPPFWYTNTILDRTLIINDNGIIPDAFSQGDFFTLIRANLRALFGLSQLEVGQGDILYYVKAPGHDYQWQYPKVYSEITNFLDENFGIE